MDLLKKLTAFRFSVSIKKNNGSYFRQRRRNNLVLFFSHDLEISQTTNYPNLPFKLFNAFK